MVRPSAKVHTAPVRSGSNSPFPIDAAAWARVVEAFGLSPQQARIVELVLQDKRDKEITEELGLRLSTVRAYLGRVFDRTGVRDRVGLVLRVFAAARDLDSADGRHQE